MARKYGDLIEIRNCISLGISDKVDTIRAIYVCKDKSHIPNARYINESYQPIFTREEASSNNYPEIIEGHALYIRPEDKHLLTFENGVFVQYPWIHNANSSIYWLRDYPGITRNFKTIYSDTSDIVKNDYVIKRGTVNVCKVIGKCSYDSETYSRVLIVKFFDNEEETYNYFEEIHPDKLFKISRRLWE